MTASAASSSAKSSNSAPGGNFRFWVEIDGMLVAGFSEVTGLQAETEVEEYHEGGVNDHVHRFPKVTKCPNLVLKRGIAGSAELLHWYESVVAGDITRKNGSVILMNSAGSEVWRWNFFGAYPVKWIGPELRSQGTEVAVETLELVHNGLKGIAS